VAEISKDKLFQPKPALADSRSTKTDKVFRAIVDAEAAYTPIKTARLRAARLAKEAEEREKRLVEPVAKKRSSITKGNNPTPRSSWLKSSGIGDTGPRNRDGWKRSRLGQ
jgi:hypothetical protein